MYAKQRSVAKIKSNSNFIIFIMDSSLDDYETQLALLLQMTTVVISCYYYLFATRKRDRRLELEAFLVEEFR